MADYSVTITIVHSITAGNEDLAQERANILSEAYANAQTKDGFPKGKWVGDQETCDAEVEEA